MKCLILLALHQFAAGATLSPDEPPKNTSASELILLRFSNSLVLIGNGDIGAPY